MATKTKASVSKKASKKASKTSAAAGKKAGKTAKGAGARVAAEKKPAARAKAASRPKVKAPEVRKPEAKAVAPKSKKLTARELRMFRDLLLQLRERITGQILSLSDDSLRVPDETPADDRTDDFDREFALNLVSSDHDAVFEIDEALRRIDAGTYGVCELSGQPIEKERLKVIPYARHCVKVQSELERGRTRYRPFGNTIAQSVDQAYEAAGTEESDESE